MSQSAIRDFRHDPFLRVHNSLMDRFGKELGPTSLAVYVALCRYANNGTQAAFPSKATIGNLIGVTVPTVAVALKKLESLGLIDIEPRFRKDGGQMSNIYTLLPIPEGEDAPEEIAPEHDPHEGEQELPEEATPPKSDNSPPTVFPTAPPVPNRPRTRRIEQDEYNKLESSDDSNPAVPDTSPKVTVQLETQASRAYFQQFKRRRWGTKAERDKFLATEAEVGSAAMIAAVTWGAENRVGKVPAICTRAKQIASGDSKERPRRGAKGGGSRLTEDNVAEAFLAEERRQGRG